MRYLPKSPAERQEMLSAIGAESMDELFSSIPERYRLRKALNLPGPFSEAEIIQYFTDRAGENSRGYTSFRGAGVYNHLRSVVTDAIIHDVGWLDCDHRSCADGRAHHWTKARAGCPLTAS